MDDKKPRKLTPTEKARFDAAMEVLGGEQFVTPAEVASYLRISRKTVYRMVEAGEIQAKKSPAVVGKHERLLIPISEVKRLLEAK